MIIECYITSDAACAIRRDDMDIDEILSDFAILRASIPVRPYKLPPLAWELSSPARLFIPLYGPALRLTDLGGEAMAVSIAPPMMRIMHG